MLRASYTFPLILKTALHSKYHSQFTDEGNDPQRLVIYPRSHNWCDLGLGNVKSHTFSTLPHSSPGSWRNFSG